MTKDELLRGYRALLASPPPGWHTLGSHVELPKEKLEFWGTGPEDGMPVWERCVFCKL